MSGGLDAVMDVRFPVVPGWDVGASSRPWDSTPRSSPPVTRSSPTRARTTSTVARSPSSSRSRCGLWPASRPRCRGTRQPDFRSRAHRAAPAAAPRGGRHGRHGPRAAAAGGVGSLAVQIARSLGARVIGTASERNHDRLRELGAEPVAYGDGGGGARPGAGARRCGRRRGLRRRRARRHDCRPRRGRPPRLHRRCLGHRSRRPLRWVRPDGDALAHLTWLIEGPVRCRADRPDLPARAARRTPSGSTRKATRPARSWVRVSTD